jgi:hypothetical protein
MVKEEKMAKVFQGTMKPQSQMCVLFVLQKIPANNPHNKSLIEEVEISI